MPLPAPKWSQEQERSLDICNKMHQLDIGTQTKGPRLAKLKWALLGKDAFEDKIQKICQMSQDLMEFADSQRSLNEITKEQMDKMSKAVTMEVLEAMESILDAAEKNYAGKEDKLLKDVAKYESASISVGTFTGGSHNTGYQSVGHVFGGVTFGRN